MHPLAFTAYKYFMHEKRETVDAVCDRAGIKPNRIYDLVENRIKYPEYLAKPLYLATGYVGFMEALHRGTDTRVIKDFAPSSQLTGESIESELLDNVDSLSAIRRKLKRYLADDDYLDRKELKALIRVAELNINEAVDIRSILEAKYQEMERS